MGTPKWMVYNGKSDSMFFPININLHKHRSQDTNMYMIVTSAIISSKNRAREAWTREGVKGTG